MLGINVTSLVAQELADFMSHNVFSFSDMLAPVKTAVAAVPFILLGGACYMVLRQEYQNMMYRRALSKARLREALSKATLREREARLRTLGRQPQAGLKSSFSQIHEASASSDEETPSTDWDDVSRRASSIMKDGEVWHIEPSDVPGEASKLTVFKPDTTTSPQKR